MGQARFSERAVESAAAACLGGAVAWSLWRLSSGGAMAIAVALAAGALVCLAARRALAHLGGAPAPFAVAEFAPAAVTASAAPDVLILTLDQAIDPPSNDAALLLDDALGAPAADSRVVRLFDAAAIPTAGELQRRIDRHLRGGPDVAAGPDDSAALHEALAVLRRSLS